MKSWKDYPILKRKDRVVVNAKIYEILEVDHQGGGIVHLVLQETK